MTLADRLAIYTLSQCPECGDQKETVFAGKGLVCRRHEGHPLHAGEAAGKEDTQTQRPSHADRT